MNTETIPKIDLAGLRQFGITTGLAIAVIFGAFFPWLLNADFPLWPWLIFAILATLGIAVPGSLRKVYEVWMKFALLLSKVTTPIILGIVYYLVVVPMGLVMKLLRKDPMAREMSDSITTYRVKSEKTPNDSIERPF